MKSKDWIFFTAACICLTTGPRIAQAADSWVQLGPSFGLGAPHAFTGSFDLIFGNLVGLTASSGDSRLQLSSSKVRVMKQELALRWYPARGSFFMGLAYGRQKIDLNSKVVIDYESEDGADTGTAKSFMHVKGESTYVMPQFGWFARWNSGFALGFDIGLMKPTTASSDFDYTLDASPDVEQAILDTEEFAKTRDEIEKTGRSLSKKSIPAVSFLRIGFLF